MSPKRRVKKRKIRAEDYLDRVEAVMVSEALKRSKRKLDYVV